MKGCGDIGLALVFHIFFQIMVSQIFLNLFVAIIIDTFFGQSEIESMPASELTIQAFVRIWSEFDTEATKFLPTHDLPALFEAIVNDMEASRLVADAEKYK